jgi:type IV pilus assembly protein PilY1
MAALSPFFNRCCIGNLGLFATLLVIPWGLGATSPPPPTDIAQVPLALAVPQHPQVLFAVGNSESMDGNLSGAIMAGSGALASDSTSLNGSSSPLQFSIPPGFVPPLDAGSDGQAPYTVTNGSTLRDNSPSRLNVAKIGIATLIQSFAAQADFALMDYKTASLNSYSTWVYYISSPDGFTFVDSVPTSGRTVVNPCYHYSSASTNVAANCAAIATLYGVGAVENNALLAIAASSDDAAINDVLYASSPLPAVFVADTGPLPPSPYPPNYQLTDYNVGRIVEAYTRTTPLVFGGAAWSTGPTNAGYVPASPQVMYVQRGFGYGATLNPTDGNVVTSMTSAGQPPTAASVATAVAQFSAPLAPETNSSSSTEIKALGGQSALPGLLTGAKNYLTSLTSTNARCPAAQYIVLLTDGLPTEDIRGLSWPPLGTVAADGYGVSATFDADGSLASTNDQALTDTISSLTALNSAGIKTYIVGLGAGVNPQLNPTAAATLKAMAIAGGTLDYFPATSPDALVQDLNAILTKIVTGSASSSGGAVNSTGLNTGSVIYQGVYTASDTPFYDWTGDVRAFVIDPSTGHINTDPARAVWRASARIDASFKDIASSSNARHVVSWNPAAANGNGAGIAFNWNTLSADQQTALQPGDTSGAARVSYVRGDTSGEQRNGGRFRNRSHLLGDIVDSSTLYVGAPQGPYPDSSYIAFEKANAQREPRLYVGANDGMLHALDPANGDEVFAFVPNAVVPNLLRLTDPYYNNAHHFFVDGSPQAADVLFNDDSWHTILLGTEAAGGKSVFALDVTTPENASATESSIARKVLWEFTDNDMGLTFSTPAVARVKSASRFAVFVGNGYNSDSETPILFALDPQTGGLIRKIDLCAAVRSACETHAANGLASPTAGNANGILGAAVDEVVAGDLQGNLWAIDVSDANPAQWAVRVLFQARDSFGHPQPITTAASLSLNPNYPIEAGLMAFFGTGQLLGTSDFIDRQTQSFYGVWDNGSATTRLRGDLEAQVITTQTSNGVVVRTVTSHPIVWSNQFGFFLDLPQSGERVTTDSRLDNGGIVFTTNTPAGDACSPSGLSFLKSTIKPLPVSAWELRSLPHPRFLPPTLVQPTDSKSFRSRLWLPRLCGKKAGR